MPRSIAALCVLLCVVALACDRERPSLRPSAPPCPERMVQLGAFCIDRHEAVIHDGHALPATNELPSVGISYFDADRACRASGFRLCAEEEWTRACAGTGEPRRRLPYGETWEAHRCNSVEWDDPPGRTVQPSGSLETCVSPEGVFDLSGNVWEWTSGLDRSETLRELRGGAAHNGESQSVCEPNDRFYLAPDLDEGLLGFRCCTPARQTTSRTE